MSASLSSRTWELVLHRHGLPKNPEPAADYELRLAHAPIPPKRKSGRSVLHEFGHVLGMQHEHGNPESTIKWNKQAVYDDMGGPPNNWPRKQVEILHLRHLAARLLPVPEDLRPGVHRDVRHVSQVVRRGPGARLEQRVVPDLTSSSSPGSIPGERGKPWAIWNIRWT